MTAGVLKLKLTNRLDSLPAPRSSRCVEASCSCSKGGRRVLWLDRSVGFDQRESHILGRNRLGYKTGSRLDVERGLNEGVDKALGLGTSTREVADVGDDPVVLSLIACLV